MSSRHLSVLGEGQGGSGCCSHALKCLSVDAVGCPTVHGFDSAWVCFLESWLQSGVKSCWIPRQKTAKLQNLAQQRSSIDLGFLKPQEQDASLGRNKFSQQRSATFELISQKHPPPPSRRAYMFASQMHKTFCLQLFALCLRLFSDHVRLTWTFVWMHRWP